jgi:hypothetical protein
MSMETGSGFASACKLFDFTLESRTLIPARAVMESVNFDVRDLKS